VDEFDLDVGSRPQVEAPTIAELMRQMAHAPAVAGVRALGGRRRDLRTGQARNDRNSAQAGPSVSAAPWIAARNFLLRGVPVVTNDLQD
jgi:hypothetical protein